MYVIQVCITYEIQQVGIHTIWIVNSICNPVFNLLDLVCYTGGYNIRDPTGEHNIRDPTGGHNIRDPIGGHNIRFG